MGKTLKVLLNSVPRSTAKRDLVRTLSDKT